LEQGHSNKLLSKLILLVVLFPKNGLSSRSLILGLSRSSRSHDFLCIVHNYFLLSGSIYSLVFGSVKFWGVLADLERYKYRWNLFKLNICKLMFLTLFRFLTPLLSKKRVFFFKNPYNFFRYSKKCSFFFSRKKPSFFFFPRVRRVL